MKMLPVSPVLLVIFLCLIFILFFLYKTSEMMSKKKLISLGILLVFIFIGINFLSYFKNTPSKQKFKLAVFPFSIADNSDVDQKWLSYAIPELVTKRLYRTARDRAIVAPIAWTYNVFKRDSLNKINYLINFCDRINFSHYLYGTILSQNKKLVLTYYLNSKTNSCIHDSIYFSIDQLYPTIVSISQQILGYFSLTDSDLATTHHATSTKVLQSYMDGYWSFFDGNYSLGINQIWQTIHMDSTFAEAYTLMGMYYLTLGIEQKSKNIPEEISAFAQAKCFLEKAVKMDSTNDENYRLLGEYYTHKERWSQAELMLNKAYRLNTNNPGIYIPLSLLHKFRYKKIGFKNEEQLYHQAIAINPCYEQAYLMLSDYYLFQNKREHAIKILEKFLQINPNSIPVLMALGKIYIVRNEINNSMQILNKVIALDSSQSDAYYNLGIVYYNLKDYENAKKLFQQAIALDNHLNSYLYLAYISELEGNVDEAISYLRKRIHFKTSLDDEFAEEARKHLYELMHSDSTK